MKIAYLGPEGSYSHLAAETFLKTERASRKEKKFLRTRRMYPFPQFPRSFRSGGNGACGRCGRTHRKQFAGRRAAKSRSFAGVLRALCREGADYQNRSSPDFPHGNPVVGNRQSIFSPSGAQSVAPLI